MQTVAVLKMTPQPKNLKVQWPIKDKVTQWVPHRILYFSLSVLLKRLYSHLDNWISTSENICLRKSHWQLTKIQQSTFLELAHQSSPNHDGFRQRKCQFSFSNKWTIDYSAYCTMTGCVSPLVTSARRHVWRNSIVKEALKLIKPILMLCDCLYANDRSIAQNQPQGQQRTGGKKKTSGDFQISRRLMEAEGQDPWDKWRKTNKWKKKAVFKTAKLLKSSGFFNKK